MFLVTSCIAALMCSVLEDLGLRRMVGLIDISRADCDLIDPRTLSVNDTAHSFDSVISNASLMKAKSN